MKIMYLVFSFTVGGTERLVADICNEMVNEGHSVCLCVVNDLYDQQLLQSLSQDVQILLLNRKPQGGGKLNLLIKIASFIKKNKIDVVHCNAFDTPELLLLTLIGRKPKIVHTVHGLGQYKKLNKLRATYRNIVCDTIIAISDSVKEDIVLHGAWEQKVAVVYNAIKLSKFTQSGKRQFDKNNIVIGNVARINLSQKGQDILIKAIGLLKDRYNITCYFAGAADSSHKEELEQLKKLAADAVRGSACEIVFLGNVEDIPGFLKGIDLFVLPSRLEGFGISLIEALYMGIPCISSDINGPHEIIGDNERGDLFEQGNPYDLAEKLAVAIETYSEKKEKAAGAAAYVKENFDIQEMCRHLLNIYR